MKYFFLISACLLSHVMLGQNRVSVDLTFEYNDDETFDVPLSISQPGLDKGTTLYQLEEGYYPYDGFQFVNWYNFHAPIHLEKDDSLTVVLGKEYDSYNYYYSGNQGAVKNNYLLERHRLLQEVESDSAFATATIDEVTSILSVKQDSMLAVAQKLSLSKRFIEDEKKYWNYYKNYHQVFYHLLRNEEKDFSILTLDDFPELDYDNEDDHYNYRDYLKLSTIYYYLKIQELDSYEAKRDVVKDIDSKTLRFMLGTLWSQQIYKRSEDGEDLMELLSRFSNSPFHYKKVKDIYNKRNRLNLGDPFPIPKISDYYGNKLDLEKAIGKQTFIYLYEPNDPKLFENFLVWNKFYVEHRDTKARFLTIGLGSKEISQTFKEFFQEVKIAGSHLTTTTRNGRMLLEDLSIGEAPRIIVLDKNLNITDFDFDAPLEKKILFGNYPFLITKWHSELGKGF